MGTTERFRYTDGAEARVENFMEIGDAVPNVQMTQTDGKPLSLHQLRGRPVVLTFLRYIGWLLCESHLVKMAQRHERIERYGARVIVVSFESGQAVAELRDRLGLPFTFVADETKVAYRVFGLERASWLQTYGQPSVIAFYGRELARGRTPALHRGQDRRQLGGDFVMDDRGLVTLAHPETSPDDRVPVSEILRALEQAAS